MSLQVCFRTKDGVCNISFSEAIFTRQITLDIRQITRIKSSHRRKPSENIVCRDNKRKASFPLWVLKLITPSTEQMYKFRQIFDELFIMFQNPMNGNLAFHFYLESWDVFLSYKLATLVTIQSIRTVLLC